MEKFTHVDESGRAKMVDVTEKNETVREAIAYGQIKLKAETLKLIKAGQIEKGAVLETARIAGIMGMKKTADIIPMCHPLLISGAAVDFEFEDAVTIGIYARAKITGKTGVEMEALSGVAIAALTIYDMCKAADKEMVIGEIKLLQKTGGKSGIYIRKEAGVMEGRVVAVCRSEEKGTMKTEIEIGQLVEDFGLDGDAHAGKWHRQVSLLGIESIEKMKAKGLPDLKFGDFAENITTEGISLYELPIGTKLLVGDEAVLEVTQIGKECHHGCEIFQKVGSCIMPKEGIFTKVVHKGQVKAGDRIVVLPVK